MEHLRRDADKMAEEAEGNQGSKMAELIAKSNALRRSHKQKLTELESLGEKIAAKAAELRRLKCSTPSSNLFVYYKSNVCYAVAYVLNITDNLNKMFYLIQVAYLYIIIF